MATPHISANKEDIAKIVVMPGDPLRAKLFAEKHMENPRQINNVRGMLGFTGTIDGKEVTVMGHGMGLDSIGIYSFELYKFYDVETIIRFGSCGSYNNDVNVWDLIIADKAYTASNFGDGYGFAGQDTIEATPELVEIAKKAAEGLGETKGNIVTTTVNSSMWFYKTHNVDQPEEFVAKGIDVVEMEAYSLYAIAKALGKKALTILTVSDHIVKEEYTTSEERQTGFNDMFRVLKTIVKEA